MPVQVKIIFSGGGDTTLTVWNDQQTQTYYINLDQEVSSMLIDPDKWILRKVTFKPFIPVAVEDHTGEDAPKVYPNPFTKSTTLEYTLNYQQTVTITFYNQFGKIVDRIEQKQSAGIQQVVWTPELTMGVYFYRLEAGEQVASGKVLLVR